jgi:hypothetical protein
LSYPVAKQEQKYAFFVANTFQIQPFHKDWRSRQMWLLEQKYALWLSEA